MFAQSRIGKYMTMLLLTAPLWACGSEPQTAKETPVAEPQEVARPSNPGNPGEAVKLIGDPQKGAAIFAANCVSCHNTAGKGGIANPGSTDGTVPPLNPIDPTISSKDYKTFAENIDLFIQHGSAPEGKNPALKMLPFGDQKLLTQHQIADVIAYVIGLNKK
jgi:mono/diheme cytochrome c family protein